MLSTKMQAAIKAVAELTLPESVAFEGLLKAHIAALKNERAALRVKKEDQNAKN